MKRLLALLATLLITTMALAQQSYDPARLARIGQKYATALKARPEWAGHLTR